MQKAVAEQQGLTAPDREVAVVYRGEREAFDDQQVSTQRVVLRPCRVQFDVVDSTTWIYGVF